MNLEFNLRAAYIGTMQSVNQPVRVSLGCHAARLALRSNEQRSVESAYGFSVFYEASTPARHEVPCPNTSQRQFAAILPRLNNHP